MVSLPFHNLNVLVGFFVRSISSVVQDSTGYAPYTLLFGMDAKLPSDVHEVDPEMEPGQRFERLHEARRLAFETNEIAQHRQEKYYNQRRVKAPEYKVGDKVLVHRPRGQKGQTTKLMHLWEGPCTVLEVSSKILCKISRDKPKRNQPKEEWIHVGRMKPFVTREHLVDK